MKTKIFSGAAVAMLFLTFAAAGAMESPTAAPFGQQTAIAFSCMALLILFIYLAGGFRTGSKHKTIYNMKGVIFMQEILERAAALQRLRQSKDDLKLCLDKLNAQIERTEQQIVEAMESSKLQSFNYDGETYYLSSRQYASLVQPVGRQFFNRLRRRSLAELIKPTIQAQALNKFVRQQQQQNGGRLPDWVEPYVSVNNRLVLGVRKQK